MHFDELSLKPKSLCLLLLAAYCEAVVDVLSARLCHTGV